ncbi:MAG: proton-conducting transporter membrane subunit [Coxiellaceae bacterium]|nr:proton-conducting transporter membrane subunit [Coxiellaceae bacterium]
MSTHLFQRFFHIDSLASVMIALVVIIGVIVVIFSSRYMKGDAHYYPFLGLLVLLIGSVVVMAGANNLWVLLAAWGVSNLLLIRLMMHESRWPAAKASGLLTAKTFLIGFICIGCAFILLYLATEQTSIQKILLIAPESHLVSLALALIVVGAMTQSGIWPFHRWLISSLNSPTPISAIMHAGLVNGGGFLLARFAPLYLSHPKILMIIFIVGMSTAMLGTLWKLMQHDVKRMLACSTMAQMGFMIAQCGLGLFPAAVAHLCWHGFFKANLFLSSSSAAQEKRVAINYLPKYTSYFLAILCGFVGSIIFSMITRISWIENNTNIILLSISFVAATQFALILLKNPSRKYLFIAVILTILMAMLYGFSISIFQILLFPMNISRQKPLNIFYDMGLMVLILSWIAMFFYPMLKKSKIIFPEILLRFYVKALNASQPHKNTITAHRNEYHVD